MMSSLTRQTIGSTKYWLQMLKPSLTIFVFIGFAFLMACMIVLSIIPIYIGNKSVERTNFILTTVRMNNYILYMNRSLAKRDLRRQTSTANTTGITTLVDARMAMNSSIQYALEQQIKAGDNRDQFYIHILKITPYTNNPNNMSVTLNFLIVYTRECKSCDKYRQSIVFKQLCSNNQLLTPIRLLIEYTNLSYTLLDSILFYSPYIPIENITIITQIVSSSQLVNVINNVATNDSTQNSSRFLANNYTLTVTTLKSNYFATLDQTGTQISASQNDGPVSLTGAVTMYHELAQTIEQHTQFSNGSNALNITINHIILQFRYSNSTIQVIIDFLINFSTNCDNQCINQRKDQLGNLTNLTIHIQPANLTNGQVSILKNGLYVLYDYSLTTQVITNFTGTIVHATPPTFTIV